MRTIVWYTLDFSLALGHDTCFQWVQNLFTDEKGIATFKGIPFMTSSGPCTSSISKGSIKWGRCNYTSFGNQPFGKMYYIQATGASMSTFVLTTWNVGRGLFLEAKIWHLMELLVTFELSESVFICFQLVKTNCHLSEMFVLLLKTLLATM